MNHVGVVEATPTLADLLDRVEEGESITITRRGRPVAVLAPVAQQSDQSAIIQELRVFGKGRRLDGVTLSELIAEGRRS